MCGIFCLIQFGRKKIDLKQARECLDTLAARGPDDKKEIVTSVGGAEVYMGFRRLAVMDVTSAGLQPFEENGKIVICNGEIYNFKAVADEFGIERKTNCDCEIILPLYEKIGFGGLVELDAEFAMVLLDKKENKIYAARDHFGVRPLYYGYNVETGIIGFASELKALHSITEFVVQVKPNEMMMVDLSLDSERKQSEAHLKPLRPLSTRGNSFLNLISRIDFYEYFDYGTLEIPGTLRDIEVIHKKINELLTEAVKKRLDADRKIGFFLSGGLDSSLVVAIATRILGPEKIVCFSIGMDDSPDVVASRKVTEFLGIKNHHVISFTVDEAIGAVPEVIECISSYDVTSIRASVMQFILAKYIKENTEIRVLLSGEGSDEVSGSYRYFRDAPNSIEFHRETIRLIRELYFFDNLRTDRTTGVWGEEVRCPYLDLAYVNFIKKINPELLMYKKDWMEKKLLRDSFVGYLPDEILFRSKEAFSDAVSTKEINWFRTLQSRLEQEITDEELLNNEFENPKPETKESLFYRRIFDKFYHGRNNAIPHYWMPRWQKERITDPSATILRCY